MGLHLLKDGMFIFNLQNNLQINSIPIIVKHLINQYCPKIIKFNISLFLYCSKTLFVIIANEYNLTNKLIPGF